jgi:hypothetical protein
MSQVWAKYDSHPEIGPLLDSYRESRQELEWVKNGLRTSDNIAEIVEISRVQAEIKRELDYLIQEEESFLRRERRDTVWLRVTIAAALIGAANIAIALFMF